MHSNLVKHKKNNCENEGDILTELQPLNYNNYTMCTQQYKSNAYAKTEVREIEKIKQS